MYRLLEWGPTPRSREMCAYKFITLLLARLAIAISTIIIPVLNIVSPRMKRTNYIDSHIVYLYTDLYTLHDIALIVNILSRL